MLKCAIVQKVNFCTIALVFGVAFVVLAALAVHAARGFEDVLRVEAAEGSGLEHLVH